MYFCSTKYLIFQKGKNLCKDLELSSK